MQNILFVCSKNQWRSPTAEMIYRNDSRINVKSAGISSKSGHQISSRDLDWADLILVMEKKQKSFIQKKFRNSTQLPEINILDIPDDYPFMDEELISIIRESVEPLIT